MRAAASLRILLVTAMVVAAAPVAAAQETSPPEFPGPERIPAGADFASEVYADPWDYANASDIHLDRGPAMFLTSRSVSGGLLRFSAQRAAHVSLVFPGYFGALPFGRDGQHVGVDAARYRHAAVRMWSGAAAPLGAALFWDGCARSYEDVCRGVVQWPLLPGWHTYLVPLADLQPEGDPWTGTARGLRLAVGPGAPTDFAVDWVRLYAPTPGLPVTWSNPSPGALATLYWDRDTNPANNTPEAARWGAVPAPLTQRGQGRGQAAVVTTTEAAATTAVPTAALPPGAYWFYSEAAGVRSGYSRRLEIAQPPLLRVLEPDEAGGEDYASARRRDPWDFLQPSDALAWRNVTDVAFRGSALHATNAGPVINDPYVWLALGPGGIDANRYHRMTFVFDYDGPFALEDAPGGGAHGRVVWYRADRPGQVQESKEIVTFTDRVTNTFDLATSPAGFVNEDDRPSRLGWRGATVTALRWDANEDRGPRRWRLHDVRLRADDESSGGVFEVRWRDAVARPGTTVALAYGADRGGADAAPVAVGLPQAAGTNAYRWSTARVPTGRYWVTATAADATSAHRTTSSGPLVVRRAPTPPSTWSGWASAGGGAVSGPAAASWGLGRVDVFAVDGSGGLLQRFLAPGRSWSGWHRWDGPPGGAAPAPPALASMADGHLDVFVRGADDALWWRRYVRGSGWSPWRSLGGTLASGPAAVSFRPGGVNVFVRSPAGAVWQRALADGDWSPWIRVAGGVTSAPAVASWAPGRLDLFARGSDARLWHRVYRTGRGWTGWLRLDGTIASGTQPAVAAPSVGLLDVAAIGPSGRAYVKTYRPGSGWSPFQLLGRPASGVLRRGIAATSKGARQVEVFALGADGAVHHTWRR